jgi:hypothetical protein
VAQVVACLCSTHKALISTPGPAEKQNKIENAKPSSSIVTLNINVLIVPIKCQRFSKCILKANPTYDI